MGAISPINPQYNLNALTPGAFTTPGAPSVTSIGYPAGNLTSPATDTLQMTGASPVNYAIPPSLTTMPSANALMSYPMSLGPNQFEMQPDPSAMYGPVGMPGAQPGLSMPVTPTYSSPTYSPPGSRINMLA